MTAVGEIPEPVIRAYGLVSARIEPIATGLINTTFAARPPGAAAVVVQRLNPIFAPEVNLDIEAVTAHLAARGLETPRLVRTEHGEAWVIADGHCWRALTFVDGITVPRAEVPAQAESAGRLIGAFHRALSDLQHEFAFTRVGVHDTAAHLARLRAADADAAASAAEADQIRWIREADPLRADILAAADGLPPMPALPVRICHGDLKISNVLFRDDRRRARCLVDLDTLGPQTIAFEIGDALRSWCNPSGEDIERAHLDLDILEAAVTGYAGGVGDLLAPDEIDSIAIGLHTVCIELAARFCADVFDDSYFGWDPDRYACRRQHNLVRARGQLALGRSVAVVGDLSARIGRAFAD